MAELDLPEVVELGEQESDWVFWPPPGEFLPDWFESICFCGHGTLGPDWHSPECPVVLEAWRWRARRLHDEVWELLDEVKTLDGLLTEATKEVVLTWVRAVAGES